LESTGTAAYHGHYATEPADIAAAIEIQVGRLPEDQAPDLFTRC
jgi:hypothetical protein